MSEPAAVRPLPTRLTAALCAWLPWQRWFAAKERPIAGVTIEHHAELLDHLDSGGPRGALLTVRVDFADGGAPERYQVPLGQRGRLPRALEPSVIAGLDGFVVYDGVDDREITSRILRAMAEGSDLGGLRFRPEPALADGGAPHDDRPLPARPLGVEQSNSSVVLDEHYLMKFFRRLEPGVNQDLELPRALGEVRSPHVPVLLGWAEGDLGGSPVTYGTVQTYVPAADGWSMALASVRDLLAGPGHADQAGGDFSAEARRLGATVAEVHADLARARGQRTLRGDEILAVVDAMRERLRVAGVDVPALDPHARALDTLYSTVAATVDEVVIQRVHGDLHLGQVLRTPTSWLLVDFEGEPSASHDERIRMRSPLRDVAGMLRSFDYAAHHRLIEPGHPVTPDGPLLERAAEWSRRNQVAFCEGYAESSGRDPRAQPLLLRALLADKAVYETVYETRSRPHWVSLPLRAVRRYAREFAAGSPLARDFL
ncbi:maltokinase N-terminal cap-like domain-containing protein [Streptomyces mayteni]